MKIMVCLKQVPHQDARLDINGDGSWIKEDNIKFEINSYDTYALEEAGQPGRLVSGDTLFLGSCGRVDLPGADPKAMYYSLNHTLKQLPDETLLYPGHFYSAEPFDTMGHEKRTNPFLRVTSLDQFLMFMGA